MARVGESDWYKAMARPLNQLKELLNHLGNIPLIIAGDLFHKWNAPAELINFALDHLPSRSLAHTYAIPGQHDLPYHRWGDVKKSAFWTLVQALKIIPLMPGETVTVPGIVPLTLHGFPWGFPLNVLGLSSGLGLEMAVVHEYLWKEGANSAGATTGYWLARKREFSSYDVVVSGDNHLPWDAKLSCGADTTEVYNCGAFMRRLSPERNLIPSVGILWDDGNILRYPLDVSKDIFAEVSEEEELSGLDVSALKAQVEKLVDQGLDFAEVVKRTVDDGKTRKEVRSLILNALKEGEGR